MKNVSGEACAPTRAAVESFGAGAEWFASAEALAARVAGALAPDVAVLVKGSRLNRLERVVDALAVPVAQAS